MGVMKWHQMKEMEKEEKVGDLEQQVLEDIWAEESAREEAEEKEAIRKAEEGDPEADMERQEEEEAIRKWEADMEEQEIQDQIDKAEEQYIEEQIEKMESGEPD